MANKKGKKQQEEIEIKQAEQQIEAVEQALSRTEIYLEKNQNSLMIIVLAIVIIVSGYLAFNKFYLQAQEFDAQSQMFVAEQYFEKDSFNLALKGDGNYLGFLEIIDEYGITKSANLANYYAGISYLKLGDFDNAIEYLEDFDGEDKIISAMAIGGIGDAYLEKGNKDKAGSQYLKAVNYSQNNYSTPLFLMKLANIYESEKDFEKATEVYNQLKTDFSKTTQGRNADKYLTRIMANKN